MKTEDTEGTAQTEEDEMFESGSEARSSKLRWLLLLFGNFFLFGSYYCYDIPSALSIYLHEPPYSLDPA